MNAIISGRTGKAIVLEGTSLWSLTIDDLHTLMARHPADLPWLLGDATDLRMLENTDHEQVKQALEGAYHCACAVDLVLIALDPELSSPTRREALVTAEPLLADLRVRKPLEHLLYGHPLPEVADVLGALQICAISGATTVYTMLYTWNALQPFLQAVHIAWHAIPGEHFADEQARTEVYRLVIREGLFYDLVMRLDAAAKANFLPGASAASQQPLSAVDMHAFFTQAMSTPSIRAIQTMQTLLQQWVRPFHKRGEKDAVREAVRTAIDLTAATLLCEHTPQETTMSETHNPSAMRTGGIQAGGSLKADNIVTGVQIQGGDADTARSLLALAQHLESGGVEAVQDVIAKNIVTGLQYLGHNGTTPTIEQFQQELAALREQLARAVQAGEIADAYEAEEAQKAVDRAIEQTRAAKPEAEKITTQLDRAAIIIHKTATAAAALEKLQAGVIKLAPVVTALKHLVGLFF